jgi:hypothetical protein
MSTVTPFVGNYAEGNGSLANGPFVPTTNGVWGCKRSQGS